MLVSGLELWKWRQSALAGADVAGVPPEEVDWLLQEVAGVDKLALRLESYKNSSDIQLQLPLDNLTQLWKRRLEERLPVQYIAGVTHWRHFTLLISNGVLIPRPETEFLIDLAAAICMDINHEMNPPLGEGHWVDLGTGSGAIALGLAEVLTKATIHAVDISEAAVAIAKKNAQRMKFADRIQFYQGSWFEPLEFLKGQLSGVVANPPYIPSGLISELQTEVARHEPHIALDGGADGLECIRHIVNTAPDYLHRGGVLLLEMMAGQALPVTELLHRQGSYENIKVCSDLAGINRYAIARLAS